MCGSITHLLVAYALRIRRCPCTRKRQTQWERTSKQIDKGCAGSHWGICPIAGSNRDVLCLAELLRTEAALSMLQGSLDDQREQWSSHVG